MTCTTNGLLSSQIIILMNIIMSLKTVTDFGFIWQPGSGELGFQEALQDRKNMSQPISGSNTLTNVRHPVFSHTLHSSENQYGFGPSFTLQCNINPLQQRRKKIHIFKERFRKSMFSLNCSGKYDGNKQSSRPFSLLKNLLVIYLSIFHVF